MRCLRFFTLISSRIHHRVRSFGRVPSRVADVEGRESLRRAKQSVSSPAPVSSAAYLSLQESEREGGREGLRSFGVVLGGTCARVFVFVCVCVWIHE